MERKIELLSPAGNADALRAAVQSGADAVYIGGPLFNARRSAKNFSVDEIKTFADYCHLYGADLHVAVNTLIKEKELPQLLEYAYQLNDAGADALIVQDLGAAQLIKKACPKLALHASTQMTVTSAEGVKYLENMGFSRVVLARELSRKEIEYIVNHTKAEIEVFVHGALCMCYSGQCLMSSLIGGRSANRGRCAQPCRLPYELTGTDGTDVSGYILSPKDLALIERLDELKKIGVKSLKIEGRLKRAEYVSAVTGIYRKYLDYPSKVSRADMEELTKAFSRSGFTRGYFDSNTGSSMMSGNNPGNTSKNEFSDEAKKRAAKDANVRKIPISITGTLKTGEGITVTVTDDLYNSVTVTGDVKAEKAVNLPMSDEKFSNQLKKLGQTPFEADYVYAETDGIGTAAVKEINEVRRRACDGLIKKRTERKQRLKNIITADFPVIKKRADRILITAQCRTYEQAEVCKRLGADVIYADEDTALKLNTAVKTGDIFKARRISAAAAEVSSAAAFEYYGDRKLYANQRLNVYNSRTADLFDTAELVTLSPELNIGEIHALSSRTRAKTEVIVYGRLTLMLMKNCPVKAAAKISGGAKYSLRDRKNQTFPLELNDGGATELLNSKPVFTADRIKEIISAPIDAVRLIFTTEDAAFTERIFTIYKKAISGEDVDNIFEENEFTRGHFFRGVE